MRLKGSSVRLMFDHVGSGLELREDARRHFIIAGADKKFHFADAVVEGEAVEHLRRLPDTSVDVIVAADVLAYIGDCADLFGEAHRVLRAHGRLVFTLEEGDAGFGLGPGGRFVHSEAYLYEAAAAAGLRVVALDRGPMRSQGGAPVVALIAALGPVS